MKKTKFGSGGALKEGSAKDIREDKKLAKKHGMSMKAWEKSEMDERHDAGVKGMADGGQSKAALLNKIQQKVGQMQSRPMNPLKGMPQVAPDKNRMAAINQQGDLMRSRQQAPQALGAPPRPTAPAQATPAIAPPTAKAPAPAPAPAPAAPAMSMEDAVRANAAKAMAARNTAPAAMKKGGCTRGMKAGGVTSAEMKKVGRNLARVANQKAATKGSTKGTMTATKSSGSTAKISKRGWGIARGG